MRFGNHFPQTNASLWGELWKHIVNGPARVSAHTIDLTCRYQKPSPWHHKPPKYHFSDTKWPLFVKTQTQRKIDALNCVGDNIKSSRRIGESHTRCSSDTVLLPQQAKFHRQTSREKLLKSSRKDSSEWADNFIINVKFGADAIVSKRY